MATVSTTISLKQLQQTVDQAVKAALQRNQAKASASFVVNPGVLAGPLLDVATNIDVARKIADDITQQVQRAQAGAGQESAQVSGPSLQSGVLITHNHIICGWFPNPPLGFNVDEK